MSTKINISFNCLAFINLSFLLADIIVLSIYHDTTCETYIRTWILIQIITGIITIPSLCSLNTTNKNKFQATQKSNLSTITSNLKSKGITNTAALLTIIGIIFTFFIVFIILFVAFFLLMYVYGWIIISNENCEQIASPLYYLVLAHQIYGTIVLAVVFLTVVIIAVFMFFLGINLISNNDEQKNETEQLLGETSV